MCYKSEYYNFFSPDVSGVLLYVAHLYSKITKHMETLLKKSIDTGLIPQQYLPELQNETELSIRIPSYVGINLESVISIEDWECTVKIRTEAMVISLWKEIHNVHITVF